MKRHVAFVPIAEIELNVLGPLIGFRKQHLVFVLTVQLRPNSLENLMRLWEILAGRPLPLDQVGNGVEPEAVDSHVEPEAHDAEHFLEHPWIVEVQIRLVGVKPMPEIGVRHRIPCPVRLLGVDEDNAGSGVRLSVSDQT